LLIDGKPLPDGEKTELFADKYRRHRLRGASSEGHHYIEIIKENRPFSQAQYNNVYMFGDFSVNIKSSNDCACLTREYYSMELYLPSRAEVLLSPRNTKLNTFSWAEQGHPFYSGAVTYCMEIEIPEKFKAGTLVLPKVKAVCSVNVNGIEVGKNPSAL